MNKAGPRQNIFFRIVHVLSNLMITTRRINRVVFYLLYALTPNPASTFLVTYITFW